MQHAVFLLTLAACLITNSLQAVLQGQPVNIDDVLASFRRKHDLPAVAASVGGRSPRKLNASAPAWLPLHIARDSLRRGRGARVTERRQSGVVPRFLVEWRQ